jgi:DNA anti-recombination protein RmuC
MLVILITAAPNTNNGKSETKNEGIIGKTELESKINLIASKINNLEPTLKPIIELTQNHEKILSGNQSKGALGEQFVAERLSNLPHEWYQRNVILPGGTVEFALRAPNKRWIPIDSQWTNTILVNKVEKANTESQRNSFRAEVHQAINKYALTAQKYVDKEHTLGFCIVAIPDSIFNLCVDIQPDLTRHNIVLISYSLLVPYILLIVNQHLKSIQTAESLEISQILSRTIAEIELIQKYIVINVTPPLEIASRQQTQYTRQKKELEQVHANINQIENDLALLKDAINPLPNSEITSIPPTLQHHLNHVRDSLLEDISKKPNEHSKNNTGK